jgi:hypothetical protein
MRSSATRLGLTAALAGLLASPLAGELVDRVLAVVDDRPLCLSDARALASLDGVDEETALARLVDDTLLFHEAFRMPQAALSPDEEHAVLERAGGDAARRRALRRRAVIRKYVEFRFRPQVRIDDEAVARRYQERYSGRADAPALENVASTLREELVAAELEVRIADWTRELRAAASVRYNPPE